MSQGHSQGDDSSTYPNTPAPIDRDGDFAQLVPLNKYALEAFSELVDRTIRHPDEYQHVSRFLYYEKADDDIASSLSSDDEGTQSIERQWKGHYRFSFQVLPRFMTTGWTLGTQHFVDKDMGVDFLLAPKGKFRVGTSHARIALNINSGCLMIYATNRSVSIHGSFGSVKLVNNSRALTESTSITIGDLQYDFQFLDIDQKTHRQDIREIMRTKLGQSGFEMPQYISSSGTPQDMQLKNYTVQKPFADGVSCVVASGIVKETGDCVIVKKVQKNWKNRDSVMNEATILEFLQGDGHHRRIVHLRETIQNTQECKIDEIMFIYEPILLFSLQEAIKLPDISLPDREEICRQCVEGLEWIHSKGVMHRDIKPTNMGVVSLHPVSALIIDFGHATLDQRSTDHMKGTIPYLAPEILDLKCGLGFEKKYTNAVDVYAMGISCFQLLCQRVEWRGLDISKDRNGRYGGYSRRPLTRVRTLLRTSKSVHVAAVIIDMINDVEDRISARAAWEALESTRPKDGRQQEDEDESSQAKRMKMAEDT